MSPSTAPSAAARRCTRLCAALSRLALGLAALGLLLVLLCVQLQVLGRYAFNASPTWTEALALLLMLYITAFGVAVGVRDGGHLGLDTLLVGLSAAWRRRLALAVHTLVGLFGAVMAHAGWAWTVMKWPETKPLLGLPEGLDYLPLVLGGGLILLFSLEHGVATWYGRAVEPAWN